MKSFLEKEIFEQPAVVSRLLDQEFHRVRELVSALPDFRYVLIAARGTSDNAAAYAKYALGGVAGLPVALATPSLYTLYKTPPRLDEALVVGISQSGESPDIVAVLEEARRQGRPTLAITNSAASPLASLADHVVELHAGEERSVAATKTYTAQLAAIALLAGAFCGRPERFEELRELPEALHATLETSVGPAEIAANRFKDMDRCSVIGRGFNYATASELALKLKELTYIDVSPYSSADFRHGPIATVGEGSTTILVKPDDPTLADMSALTEDLRSRGAVLLSIVEGAELVSGEQALPLGRPVPGWINPILAIVPGHLFALRLTLAKGLNPDRPRSLQKVTRTV